MSFSATVYSEIERIIKDYGNEGTVLHNATGGNMYDDDGVEVSVSTDFTVGYTTGNLTREEKIQYSQDNETRKVYILNDGVVSVEKGDNFLFNNGTQFTIEEVDDVGETQNLPILKKLICQRV